ncbi:glycosyl hydrolase family 28 protein [Prolixibacteraceae bacterium Z1-6]|uniref:Glycosyl hydrolase family 28 protein n=1 Tax=Draconibacterium aestuarii TaxID=2998507 RepID=A0A9X3F427_9BACT|nr:glycosyl hydrolase family 28 protein [Prolixibacteraceae bacterium Z1-6]
MKFFLRHNYFSIPGLAVIAALFISGSVFTTEYFSKEYDLKQFNITDFGAVSDTTVLSTKAIQTAIDECSKNGGTVVIPAGNYKSGTLYFKDNVTLQIDRGATLFGSLHLKDYPENNPDYTFFRKGTLKRALIYAEKCTNIAITGDGTIDGQGAKFWIPKGAKVNSYSVRPYVIWMIKSRDIRIEGVRLRNSPLWMQHYLACDNLYIHNIDVFNHSNKNNDMMDIDGCHDVRISDCTGDTDDDGITFKSTSGRANKNVVVTNCILSSHCNAIKMGTESNTGFKNFAISNIVIRPSKVSDKYIYGRPEGIGGIALETVDGAEIDGVVISNIRIDGTLCPIFLRLGNRARKYFDEQSIERPGVLQNVSINNVVATGAQQIACSISGLPDYPVENISLSNISVEFEGGGTLEHINREVPEEEQSYPEFNMFGELPNYGFFIRHAQNINFSNIRLFTKNSDLRPALFLSDVQKSDFRDINMDSTEGNNCNIVVENSQHILFSGCRVNGPSSSFIRFKGNENQNIYIQNNLLPEVKQVFTPSETKVMNIRETGNIK